MSRLPTPRRIERVRERPEASPLVAGKYRVVSKLGSGGSATVSLAVSQGIAGFSKLVVLKAIRGNIKPGSRAVDGFLDEARLSARLNHPNVVQVYEVVEHEGLPVIVMEYLDGLPLAGLMAEAYDSAEFTPEARLTIVTKVLAGLHHAHELCDFSGRPLGLVHRDVSPHNVMVTYDGQVKLVDFGIAQLGASPRPLRNERVPGKLAYMAPEQMLGAADRRADVFAAGILLWELITLRRFWGTLSEPAVMRRLLAFNIPHRGTLSPEMDAELAAICSRALASAPDERYASALDMQADLERYLVARSGVVVESTIGRLVQRAFGSERAHSQQSVRALLAELDAPLLQSRTHALPDEDPSPDEESMARGATVATVATCRSPKSSATWRRAGWTSAAWRSRALVALLGAAFLGHASDTRPPEAAAGRGGAEARLPGEERAFFTVRPAEPEAPAERTAPRAAPITEPSAGTIAPPSEPVATHEPPVPTASPRPSRSAVEKQRQGGVVKGGVMKGGVMKGGVMKGGVAKRREPRIELEPGADLRRLRRAPGGGQ
jgi:serine/threonine protein kinase